MKLFTILLSVVAAQPVEVSPYVRLEETCYVDQVFRPGSIEVLQQQIQSLDPENSMVSVKGRAMGTSHIWCPATSPTSWISRDFPYKIGKKHRVVIETDGLPRTTGLNDNLVTASCSHTVQSLLDYLTLHNKTLIAGPMWSGLSLCGAISVGAHGSSTQSLGGISEYVRGFSVVDAKGNIRRFPKAAAVNFGALGVMIDVTLEVQDRSSVQVSSQLFTNLSSMVAEAEANCAYGQFNYFPEHEKTLLFCIDDSNKTDNLTGNNFFFTPVDQTQKDEETDFYDWLNALPENDWNYYTKVVTKKFLEDANTPLLFGGTSWPVHGHKDKILHSNYCEQSTGCAYEWTPGTKSRRYYNLDVSIPRERMIPALEAWDDLRKTKYNGAAMASFAVSIHARFGASSGDLLLGPSSGKRVSIEAVSHFPTNPFEISRDFAMIKDLEKILKSQPGSYLHPGKNSLNSFRGSKQFNRVKILQFELMRKRADPHGMFMTEFFRNFIKQRISCTPYESGHYGFPDCELRGFC